MRCPNPDCPYARKRGRAAEFRSGITVCTDCGAALVEGEAAPASPFAPGARAGAGAQRFALPWPAHVVNALVVTGVAACAALALGFVPLPYIEREALASFLENDSLWRLTQLSAGAIGVTPWLTAALVAEVVGVIVPKLRARRLVPNSRERNGLSRAALVVGALFALMQAWMLTTWIANINSSFFDSVAPELWSLGPKLLVVATLVGAACLTRLLAFLIDRHGIGNGLVLVAVLPLLFDVALELERHVYMVRDDVLVPFEIALTLGLFAVPLIVAWRLVRATPETKTWASFVARPSAGIVPATLVFGVPSAFNTLAMFVDVDPPAADNRVVLTVTALLGAALVPLCARAWANPARAALLRARGEKREVTAADEGDAQFESHDALVHSWMLNGALVGVLLASMLWLPYGMAHALSLVVLVAIGRDVVDEVQARRAQQAPLVSLVGLQRFDLVGPVIDALAREKIHASLRGAHVRVLSHFFAPWVPVEVLVRSEDAKAAHAIVDDVIARCTVDDARA